MAPRDKPIALSLPLPGSDTLVLPEGALHFVRGGALVSAFRRSGASVEAFVDQEKGVAGLNGGFFASLSDGAGSYMVGPMLSGRTFQSTGDRELARSQDRPLVVWNERQMAVVPFESWMGKSRAALSRLLPDATDAFLAGGWLVRNGKSLSEAEIRSTCVLNAMHSRRRAALGIDRQNRIVLAATDYSVDSATLAKSLTKLDVKEAVLLDGGFSTALVWRGKVLVNGHSRKGMPSRDVPHALVVLAE